jgi:hypothetical protein
MSVSRPKFLLSPCVELLDALGILHIEAVVLDHRADAELLQRTP